MIRQTRCDTADRSTALTGSLRRRNPNDRRVTQSGPHGRRYHVLLWYLYLLMSGVYTARTETSQEEQRRIRITRGSALIHSFPMPLGTEIGHLDRTVTTDVTFF